MNKLKNLWEVMSSDITFFLVEQNPQDGMFLTLYTDVGIAGIMPTINLNSSILDSLVVGEEYVREE